MTHSHIAAAAAKFQALLAERQAGNLIYYKPSLVEITSKTTIQETLKLLAERNILAVPVFDEAKGEYVGIVHTFDIMLYIAYGFFKLGESVSEDAIRAKIESVKDLPASELIGIAHYGHAGWWHSGLMVYEPTRSLADILDVLSSGVQRVLVRYSPSLNAAEGAAEEVHQGKSSELKVLSQSDLIKFLIIHAQATSDFAENSIESLGLTKFDQHQKASTVDEKTSALDAFRHMYSCDADAVGIVDGEGRLVANLSASDLRGLTLRGMVDLLQPVETFLKRRHQGHYVPAITCPRNASLKTVMVTIAATNVHRIWVTDPATQKPLGVVRLTDVLKAFNNGPQYQ